jgi:hypothetical protein
MNDFLLQFQEKVGDTFWPRDEWRDARTGELDELKEYAVGQSDPGNNRIRWRIVKVFASVPTE